MQKQWVVVWLVQYNFFYGVVFFCDGLVYDLLWYKVNFLKLFIFELYLCVYVVYGFIKDVVVYSVISLFFMQIYIVGWFIKKLQQQCQFIMDGYVVYLVQLKYSYWVWFVCNIVICMVLCKGSFGLFGQGDFLCFWNYLFCIILVQFSGFSYWYEWIQSQVDGEQWGQCSMSMVVGCWGCIMIGCLELGVVMGFKQGIVSVV